MKLALPSIPRGGTGRSDRRLFPRLLNRLVVGGGLTGLLDWMRQEGEVTDREQEGDA